MEHVKLLPMINILYFTFLFNTCAVPSVDAFCVSLVPCLLVVYIIIIIILVMVMMGIDKDVGEEVV